MLVQRRVISHVYICVDCFASHNLTLQFSFTFSIVNNWKLHVLGQQSYQVPLLRILGGMQEKTSKYICIELSTLLLRYNTGMRKTVRVQQRVAIYSLVSSLHRLPHCAGIVLSMIGKPWHQGTSAL